MPDEDVILRLQAEVAESRAVEIGRPALQLQAVEAKVAQLEISLEHRTVISQAVDPPGAVSPTNRGRVRCSEPGVPSGVQQSGVRLAGERVA